MTTNGGKNTFGDAWATRFYKRQKLKRRAATTKMRILPANFEELKEAYIRIYSAAVNKYNVPRRRLAYLEDAAEELQRRISGYGW